MRLNGLLVLGLVLLPAPVWAQSVHLADLVGKWMRGDDTLFLQADSTFYFVGKKGFKTEPKRWNYLRGDTISLYKNGACITGAKTCKRTDTGKDYCSDGTPTGLGVTAGDCLRGEPGYEITLKDQQLTLSTLKGTSNPWEAGTYTRVEASKPSP